MLKRYFLSVFFLIGLVPSYAQSYGWVDLTANLPDTSLFGGLGKVVFIGDDGWITQQWYTLPRGIYYTADGGQTFTTHPLPDDAGTVGDIFIRSNYEGYVVTYWDEQGNTGKIFHTDDARSGNWSLLAEVSGSGFYSITFPPLPAATGYLGSAAGEVWKINGGNVMYDGWCNTLYDVMEMSFPVNTDTGWAATFGIEHREAGGWQMGGQNFGAQGLKSICFIDNKNGWICGDNQFILHTTDGHNWVIQHGNNTKTLHSIRMVNLMNGWAVGNGLIFHTTDGGDYWKDESEQVELEDIELTAVSVADIQTAYAVGARRSTHTPVFLKYLPVTGTSYPKGGLLTAIPNPASEEIVLICPDPDCREADIEIINSIGNRKGRRSVLFEDGKARVNVDHLTPGMYIIGIRNGNEFLSLKMIKR